MGTNPVDPSSPLQTLTHTITIFSCILNSTDVWFCLPQCGLYSFCAKNKAEHLSPVDPGISREVTDLYPSRGYTHPVTRAIEVSHAARKPSCDQETFSSISQLKRIFFTFKCVCPSACCASSTQMKKKSQKNVKPLFCENNIANAVQRPQQQVVRSRYRGSHSRFRITHHG